MLKILHNYTQVTRQQSNAENSPKWGFNNTWTVNFQMFKLDFEKANCQHPLDHQKKQESSRKTSTSALLTIPKPLTVWITTNWKIQETGIPEHLTCFLRNLYAGQEATVRTGHGTTDWFQIGKGVRQSYILTPCLFNLYAEHIMWNAWLDEAQTGIKIARRNINNLRYADDTTRKWRGTEEPLDESKRGEWKSWLKTQHSKNKDKGIRSHHFKANRWGSNGNSETFFSSAPKSLQMVTVAMKLKGACSLEEKLWPT